MTKPPLLRARDVAAQLGVTSNRVYQLIAAGVIPATRINRSLFVPRAAWDAWLRQRVRDALANADRAVTSPSDDPTS
jgi:excisionase family DNA binding protein